MKYDVIFYLGYCILKYLRVVSIANPCPGRFDHENFSRENHYSEIRKKGTEKAEISHFEIQEQILVCPLYRPRSRKETVMKYTGLPDGIKKEKHNISVHVIHFLN